ncbi:MAG TPA: TraR/DksA C4-type zinc finger protein [Bdellovibrionota bacterium]|jgi:DnaK suppressor protein
MASKSNSKKTSSAGAASEGSARTVEAKLARMLGLANEAESEKIVTLLKGHGLNKTQVLALVEAIRREEQEIIFADSVLRGELQTNQEDLMDEADLASSDIDQGMKMRMANRENFKVKRLHRALDRIKDGSYGECEGCGSDIGFARLSARIIAELCIACKEEEERKENLSAVGRKPKSMGQTLGNKLTVS